MPRNINTYNEVFFLKGTGKRDIEDSGKMLEYSVRRLVRLLNPEKSEFCAFARPVEPDKLPERYEK